MLRSPVESATQSGRTGKDVNRRAIGYVGIGSIIFFWLASFVFGALRPSYSHVVNTISELGAVGTPYSVLWNLIGSGVLGVLLAVVGVTIAREAQGTPSVSRTVATLLLAVSGLAVAGQGLMPAEMINGVADVTSASTRAHFVSSLISGAAWIVGALMLVRPMSRNPHWKGLHIVSIVLVVLVVAASIVLQGTFPDGLAQRIGNTFFCLWFVVMSIRLISLRAVPEAA